MGAGTTTVDSNITGLAVAEETLGSPGTLPGTPVWYPLEPNSYGDFGAQVANVKREPIASDRQKRKGSIVGIDVDANVTLDWTSKAPYILMQGFMFADWRAKDTLPVTAVSGTQYTVASGGAAFTTTSLLFAEGFAIAANNGLKSPSASTGTTISATGLAVETPGANAQVTRVGFQGASGDLTMTVVSSVPQLNATVLNFTTLGLIPGEWIFVGGDAAGVKFATAACNGFYRIASISATALVFDRWPTGAVADPGTGKTLQVFLGHAIKNEASAALQKFRTYQFERYLGPSKYQFEKGCGANSLKLSVKTREKVTAEMGYVGMTETTGAAAATGTRKTTVAETAFNAATSFSRVVLTGQDGLPLVGILTDLELSIDNGIEGIEGIGNTLGKVDLSASDFSVSGSVEAFFSTTSAVDAVKTNPDCSLDCAMVENVGGNATGWLFDMPLVMLGDARLKVEKDKPIKLPLSLDAAAHATLNHTLLAMRFAYLPQLAL